MSSGKFRLVTRSDFDGLVCAAILKELDLIDEIKFVHPKDMQDGLVEVSDRDITTNLPYVPGVRLAFDHHASETIRLEETAENHIIIPGAMSAARAFSSPSMPQAMRASPTKPASRCASQTPLFTDR